jgi:serine/threonine protein kinase
MGTIAYMSPEQATGQAVDERADLYSLGVMLYEMIAGVVPFDAELPSQVLARQLIEAPPPLPEGTPPPLAELVYALMEKKPEDRPASAQAVLERLNALTPTPSGRVLPPKRQLPKHVVYTAGALALLLVVLIAVLSRGKHDESATVSPEPSASVAASAKVETAPSAASTSVASTAASTASTEPEPAVQSPRASSEPSAKAASKSGAKSAKGAKSSNSSATESHASAPPKRKTGPGGIYIPPPSQWFK